MKALDFLKLQNGVPMKRPAWYGYWKLSDDGNTVMMHCKDGQVIDIRDTDRVMYTLANITADDWIEATSENCPLLGGVAEIAGKQAESYFDRGIPVYIPDLNLGYVKKKADNEKDDKIFEFSKYDNEWKVYPNHTIPPKFFIQSDFKFILLQEGELELC